MLSNPLHGMPPMSTLCMAFIESLLVRTKSSKYACFRFFTYCCLFCIVKPLFTRFCFLLNCVKTLEMIISSLAMLTYTFSALTLLVGRQEGHPTRKNWVVRYWHGYLSGARCKLFAYGVADATATPSSLAPVKSSMVYLSSAGLPGLSWRKAIKRM